MMENPSQNHFETATPGHRPPLASLWQQVVHVIMLIVGWIAFFIYFNKFVLSRSFGFIEFYILVCAIIVPTVTGWWIMHNLQYRRENLRKHAREVKEEYVRDWEGCTVFADWPALQKAHKIRIDVEPEEKHYLVER